jgi:hypothetical protein
MPAALDYQPLIQKLLEKSKQERVGWSLSGGGRYPTEFRCVLGEGEEQYVFTIRKSATGYELEMWDGQGIEILKVLAEDQIIWTDESQETTFTLLGEIFELARRKALQVEPKLSYASRLLESL